jgi:hypothetical protein
MVKKKNAFENKTSIMLNILSFIYVLQFFVVIAFVGGLIRCL